MIFMKLAGRKMIMNKLLDSDSFKSLIKVVRFKADIKDAKTIQKDSEKALEEALEMKPIFLQFMDDIMICIAREIKNSNNFYIVYNFDQPEFTKDADYLAIIEFLITLGYECKKIQHSYFTNNNTKLIQDTSYNISWKNKTTTSNLNISDKMSDYLKSLTTKYHSAKYYYEKDKLVTMGNLIVEKYIIPISKAIEEQANTSTLHNIEYNFYTVDDKMISNIEIRNIISEYFVTNGFTFQWEENTNKCKISW